MTVAHEAVAACPVLTAADKALIRAMCTRRFAYCLAASESATNLVALDPDAGTVPLYLIQNAVMFAYDSTDSLTAHDGVTCLVTSDGKRYKSATFTIDPRSVLTKGTVAQPVSPSVGDRYLIPTAATGTAWNGKDNQVGEYTAAGWFFSTIPIGRFLYVRDETAFYHRNASGVWTAGVGTLVYSANTVPITAVIATNASFTVKVENQTTNTPPASPALGVAYIIGPVPTGAWIGNAGKLAICLVTGAFTIIAAAAGDEVYDKALAKRLRFNGTLWASGSEGITVVSSQSISSPVATVDFITGLDDTYDSYVLQLSGLKTSGTDAGLTLIVGVSTGPTWITAANYTVNGAASASGGLATFGNSAATSINLNLFSGSVGLDSSAGTNLSGAIQFDNPESTDLFTMEFHTRHVNTSGALRSAHGSGGYIGTPGAVTALRFAFTNGNITAGRFVLYGRAKS